MSVAAYYQTFESLDKILDAGGCGLTDLVVAAIHFGIEPDGQPYLHLNDRYAGSFKTVIQQMKRAYEMGIRVSLMIGGAGGGYETLLQEHMCVAMLMEFLWQVPWISGVNFDVEETVDFASLTSVVDVVADAGYHVSFAPLYESVATDQPGMGGFSYRLIRERYPAATMMVQCYGAGFSPEGMLAMVQNGYRQEQLILGALADQGIGPDDVRLIYNQFPRMGGTFVWELFQAKPNPEAWCRGMSGALTVSALTCEMAAPQHSP